MVNRIFPVVLLLSVICLACFIYFGKRTVFAQDGRGRQQGRGLQQQMGGARVGAGRVDGARVDGGRAQITGENQQKVGSIGVAWYTTWESGLAEAKRSNRPIFFMSAAATCSGVPGVF